MVCCPEIANHRWDQVECVELWDVITDSLSHLVLDGVKLGELQVNPYFKYSISSLMEEDL